MKPQAASGHVTSSVDARGKPCPLPIVLLSRALRAVQPGELVELLATDPATLGDLEAFCASTGNVLDRVEREGEILRARVQRSARSAEEAI